jgi:hypothetical protein
MLPSSFYSNPSVEPLLNLPVNSSPSTKDKLGHVVKLRVILVTVASIMLCIVVAAIGSKQMHYFSAEPSSTELVVYEYKDTMDGPVYYDLQKRQFSFNKYSSLQLFSAKSAGLRVYAASSDDLSRGIDGRDDSIDHNDAEMETAIVPLSYHASLTSNSKLTQEDVWFLNFYY